MPAIYQLWRTNLLPAEFSLVAVARRPYTDEAFAAEVRASLEKYSRVLPIDESAWAGTGPQDQLPAARLRRRRRLRPAQRAPRRARPRARHRRQPPLLPGHAAVPGDRDRPPDGPGRSRPRDARLGLATSRRREAVRARLRLGPAAQPRGQQGLSRVAGLPHRPLPRQRDGPQHAGLPVRQRHLRAGLEPQLHRPRSDHRGGVDRGGRPRLVL